MRPKKNSFLAGKCSPAMLFCLLCLSCWSSSFAQQRDVWQQVGDKKRKAAKSAQKQKGAIGDWVRHVREWGVDDTYEHELSLGADLHTNGFGGHLRYVRNDGGTDRTVWLLGLSTIKHPKEVRQQRNGDAFRELGPFRPFYLGKVNTIHSLQAGYGKEQVLLPSVIDDNISISVSLVVGVSVVLQKPVHLNLIHSDSSGAYIRSASYSAAGQEHFLSGHRILGADRWSRGLGDSRVIPGIFLEPALVFVSARNKTFVQRIYIGGRLSYYSSGLEIMALHKPRPFHTSFFVALGLGKRW